MLTMSTKRNNQSSDSLSSEKLLLLNQNADDLRTILNIPQTKSTAINIMPEPPAVKMQRRMSKVSNRSITSSESKGSEEWVRNSLEYVRRLTFEEMARRSRDWKQLKSSEWSPWGQWLFFLGFILLFSCLGTLIWKLAYIDFFLYKMNEDKHFINHDLQQIIQDERSGRNIELDYEPIIRRTCSNSNIRFIFSLIICCILSAVGFLLICCGLSGITVEVEENDENAMYNQLKHIYEEQDHISESPNISKNALIPPNSSDPFEHFDNDANFNDNKAPTIYPILERSEKNSSIDSDSLKSAKSHLDPFEPQNNKNLP